MKLRIKNVGRIREAEIAIEGITVICGDNNTGKSTIGKTVYCIYSAFYTFMQKARQERIDTIIGIISGQEYYRNKEYGVHNNLVGRLVDTKEPTVEQIREVIIRILRGNNTEIIEKTSMDIIEKIQRTIAISEDEIATAFLQRALASEFDGKFANVNSSTRRADVFLETKNGTITFHTIGKEQQLVIDHYFDIKKRIAYLDDPFVLDETNEAILYYRYNKISHREAMAMRIRESVKHRPENAIEEILHDKEIQAIIQKMDAVSNGTLVMNERDVFYRHVGLKEELSITNLSTGVKTFAILRALLLSGYLEKNGIIVLDEPEVHLHPEWQVKLAEIIVMLQKAYGLNAIITTHSNEFLLALDYYSNVYEVRGNSRFYLTELERQKDLNDYPGVIIKEKTDDMESMYSSVSEPYLRLYEQVKGV